ncbi:MAG: type II toxin-antitoxin system YafQ family toxin [Sporomusaceae bacterium]|nr:type II toxin-antitoxin system YafQ family toxin [Sporomusaceae bacterium]
MTLTPIYTKKFAKDVDLAKRRGKDTEKLKKVMTALIHQLPLEPSYRDHLLTGNYRGRRECHIESDWLLIYQSDEESIIFERTGTHSDLF